MPKPKSDISTEVLADPDNDRRRRRKFSSEDKLRILEEIDAADRGDVGKILRKEGLYSSQVSLWRTQLREGGTSALEPKTAGRPSKDTKDHQIEQLEAMLKKTEKELNLARKIIEFQKKAHEVFGLALPDIEDP